MNPVVEQVTARITERSSASRQRYLDKINRAADEGPNRTSLSCSNLAHGIAACGAVDKDRLAGDQVPNLAIVTAYNDMLSAHQPYQDYPARIRAAASAAGAVAQVAGGVPAMCDGVTQGQAGMELSLFSRDIIALSTAVALSHDMFDAALYLGICDKIVPGLMIGALTFGHLPAVFVPAGPMPSGLPNKEKARVREAHAAGEVGRDELLAAESASYHSPGTCTFYGTANSNQMLMEFMGLQLPGGSFVNPDDPLRDKLTDAATLQALAITRLGNRFTPVGKIIDAAAITNAVIGLLATGGSTNHTLHLIAIAAAAGIALEWRDFADLSAVIPTLAQVYPNGQADVNHFHNAGGLGFVIRELLAAGLLNREVNTILGPGLDRFTQRPQLKDDEIVWKESAEKSADRSVLRGVADAFEADGGLKVLDGNIGQAVVKTSAVAAEHRRVSAPARVFRSQSEFAQAFEAGELNGDLVAVVTHQGPAANGMPELHKLSPYLGVMQNQGHKVALLTDGRMSGASGKVLAAIQVTPEAAQGGAIGKIRDGDLITIDAEQGSLVVPADVPQRTVEAVDLSANQQGCGRELLQLFRERVGVSSAGASIFSGV
ncbi:MAG: phosphogluconate dehydratase [Pseudomonadales bacterium]